MATTPVAVVDVTSLALSPLDIGLRMLLAMLVGAVIGTEREYTHRPAGMRTHMLVALGACAVMTTIDEQSGDIAMGVDGDSDEDIGAGDPARLSAQVITGLGFLGAGTIMREGPSIKGLTTAASIWATGCLGVAVGGGYYMVAVVGGVCILVTLIVFEWLQKKIVHNRYALYLFSVTCTEVAGTMERIYALAGEADALLNSFHVDEVKTGFKIRFKADFGGRHADERLRKFISDLSADPHTSSVTSDRSRM
jgi:putative Mg2+ transporter-C (MgtC) family protein